MSNLCPYCENQVSKKPFIMKCPTCNQPLMRKPTSWPIGILVFTWLSFFALYALTKLELYKYLGMALTYSTVIIPYSEGDFVKVESTFKSRIKVYKKFSLGAFVATICFLIVLNLLFLVFGVVRVRNFLN
jgi:hypothetical protein